MELPITCMHTPTYRNGYLNILLHVPNLSDTLCLQCPMYCIHVATYGNIPGCGKIVMN